MRTAKADIQDTVTLRPLTEADVTPRYLGWFRDRQVTKYLEAQDLTKEEATNYIRQQQQGGYFMYAIIVGGVHIGNLKIGPVWQEHGLADMVAVIGDAECRGQGYAAQAIALGAGLAWNMGVRKISAGVYAENTASLRAYLRAGFHVEGVLEEQYLLDGKPQDQVCIAMFNPALHNNR